MTVYFLDRSTLEIKDVVNASKFNLKFDEETNATSSITLHKKPNANQNDFVVVKRRNAVKYQGIVSQLQGEKNSNQVVAICKDISNLFNRKIYVDGQINMETSLEDFLYYTINKFFKQGDEDEKVAMPYLSIVQKTQTSITEPINDEDGIYNFHTFMTNCRQNKNISVNFEIKQEEIVVTIENIGNQDIIKIDTTNNDVIKYNKVYEMDITSRVTVKCGDTGNVLNYYLLIDRTISTDKTSINRANGDLTTIYVDEETKAYEQASNIFKGNRYNHLVEFEIKQDSKLVNTDELIIGRPIQIKTNDDILDSYISSIEVEEKTNFIKYKSGNIRVDLIDKLKQEPYKIGTNKVDRANVKNFQSTGMNNTYSCDYLNMILNNYYPNEIRMGTLKNNKPWYVKTLEFTTTAGTTNSPKILNVDDIIYFYGRVKQPSGNYSPLSFYLSDADKCMCFWYASQSVFQVRTGSSYGFGNTRITVAYTKTTD